MNSRSKLHVLTHLAWSMLCSATCLCFMQTAAAGEPGDAPTVKVYYGDLNLQRPASIASLYRRIERAAERVCTRTNGNAVQQKYSARKCTELAIDRAVVNINMPALAKHAAEMKLRESERTG